MSEKPRFVPTVENTYLIEYPQRDLLDRNYDFAAIFKKSLEKQNDNYIEQACNLRFEAFQRLTEIIPDNEDVVLEWDEQSNQIVLELIKASAIDHFLVRDFEMSAAMLEMLLDLDPEDHLEATTPLAYCYIALGEHELFDEIINDISDKYPEKTILRLWSEFMRSGEIPSGELTYFKRNKPQLFSEFTATEHHADTKYIEEIESPSPSKETLARDQWLRTEHLWDEFPEFIVALRDTK